MFRFTCFRHAGRHFNSFRNRASHHGRFDVCSATPYIAQSSFAACHARHRNVGAASPRFDSDSRDCTGSGTRPTISWDSKRRRLHTLATWPATDSPGGGFAWLNAPGLLWRRWWGGRIGSAGNAPRRLYADHHGHHHFRLGDFQSQLHRDARGELTVISKPVAGTMSAALRAAKFRIHPHLTQAQGFAPHGLLREECDNIR